MRIRGIADDAFQTPTVTVPAAGVMVASVPERSGVNVVSSNWTKTSVVPDWVVDVYGCPSMNIVL